MIKPMNRSSLFGLSLLLLAITGCSHNPVSVTTGYVLEGIVENKTFPYVLAQNDPDIACNLGQSFEYFLGSINDMTDSKNSNDPMIPLLSSLCSEDKAREEELRSIRALRKHDIEEAKDASIIQKQWLAKTAQRRLDSFNIGMNVYEFESTSNSPECPTFHNDRDEMSFMLSITMGSLAIKNDAESGMLVGVPRSMASSILSAANCLDNEKWGGAPQALQALLWQLLPNKKPTSITQSNWEILEYASRNTVTAGNHLGSALHAITAEISGNKEQLYKALDLYKETAGHQVFTTGEFLLVEKVSTSFVQDISNALWTSEVGYRTPLEELGSLPPTIRQEQDDSEDLDSLL